MLSWNHPETILHIPLRCSIKLWHLHRSIKPIVHLLGNQDCQIKIHNYAKPLWMAGATNRSARKRHSKRPKNNQRSLATSSITFCWSLVCTCIVPLFRSLMKVFVAWTSIPPCKKTGLQTLRLTPNLKLIHVSLVLTLVHGPTRISKVLTPHRHHKLTVVWKASGIRWRHGYFCDASVALHLHIILFWAAGQSHSLATCLAISVRKTNNKWNDIYGVYIYIYTYVYDVCDIYVCVRISNLHIIYHILHILY